MEGDRQCTREASHVREGFRDGHTLGSRTSDAPTDDLRTCTGCGVREENTRERTLFGGLCGKCDEAEPDEDERGSGEARRDVIGEWWRTYFPDSEVDTVAVEGLRRMLAERRSEAGPLMTLEQWRATWPETSGFVQYAPCTAEAQPEVPVCAWCGGPGDPFSCPKHPGAMVALPSILAETRRHLDGERAARPSDPLKVVRAILTECNDSYDGGPVEKAEALDAIAQLALDALYPDAAQRRESPRSSPIDAALEAIAAEYPASPSPDRAALLAELDVLRTHVEKLERKYADRRRTELKAKVERRAERLRDDKRMQWKELGQRYAAVRDALRDFVGDGTACEYGPACEDCRVCRARQALAKGPK